LAALVQASIIRHEENGRYTIHELLHQFAAEKWRQLEADSAIQQAHSRYFLTWLADQEAGLNGPQPQIVMALLRQELANIRQAWGWAVTFEMTAEIKTAVYSLVAYLEIAGLLPEGQKMLEQAILALRHTQGDYSLPRLLVGQSKLLARMGRYGDAEQRIQEAVSLALRHEEALDIGNGYLTWASIILLQGDYQAAARYTHEALLVAESESLPRLKAASLNIQAHTQVRLGEREEVVKPLYQQALIMFQELGDRRQMGWVLNQLGGLALNWGKYNQAKRYWQQALDLFIAVGEQAAMSVLSNNLGDIYIRLGCFEKAKACYQQSWQMAVDTGTNPTATLSGFCGVELMAGNLAVAEEYGRRGLQAACQTNRRVQEAYSLVELGPVLLAREKWPEVADLYHRVIHLSTTLGDPYLMVDGMAGLAQAALCQDQQAEALEWVNCILAQNDWETLGGAYDPFMVYLICYRVLTAYDDARAGEILAVANGRLQGLLAELDEESTRSC
jgi:tetratricopeptide (TPR) repeat protein